MKVKEESEKAGLKINIQKTKTMASGPITMANGETVETDYILGASKIREDGDCSHEIKRLLLLGRKTMTNLDSILKSRYITLLTKVLHPGCIKIYLTYMQNTSWKMLGWMKLKLQSRLPGEISIISDVQMTPP